MAFQILQGDDLAAVEIRTPVLNPAEAEIHVTFHLHQEIAKPELRGRLMGPRCHYSTTVEIAYPFRPLPKTAQAATKAITGRVVIPEPEFWDPVIPFLYEGPIELWEGDRSVVHLWVSLGLRSLKLPNAEVRWNGKRVPIHLREVEAASETTALAWRRDGVNTWLIADDENAAKLCRLADRLGFLVFIVLKDAATARRWTALAEHACCAGWVVAPDLLGGESVGQLREISRKSRKQLFGLDARERNGEVRFDDVDFIFTSGGAFQWQEPRTK